MLAAQPAVADLARRGRLPGLAPGQTAPNAEHIATVSDLVALGTRPVLSPGRRTNTPLTAAMRDDYCSYVRGTSSAFRRSATWSSGTSRTSPPAGRRSSTRRLERRPGRVRRAPRALLGRAARVPPRRERRRAGALAERDGQPAAVERISHTPLTFIRRMGDAYGASGRTKRIFDTVAHHPYGSSSRERPWRRTAISPELGATGTGSWTLSTASTSRARASRSRASARPAVRLHLVHGGRLPDRAGGEGGGIHRDGRRRDGDPDDAGGEPEALRPT